MEPPFDGIREINFTGQVLDTRTIMELSDFQYLTSLDLSETNITDNTLKFLSNLPWLTNLILYNTNVTSKFAEHLEGHLRLNALFVESTLIDEDIFQVLSSVKNLKFLNVAHTGLRSVAGLENLVRLEQLDLRHTLIDDFAVEIILALEHLTFLNVNNTLISPKGLEYIQKNSNANIIVTGS